LAVVRLRKMFSHHRLPFFLRYKVEDGFPCGGVVLSFDLAVSFL